MWFRRYVVFLLLSLVYAISVACINSKQIRKWTKAFELLKLVHGLLEQLLLRSKISRGATCRLRNLDLGSSLLMRKSLVRGLSIMARSTVHTRRLRWLCWEQTSWHAAAGKLAGFHAINNPSPCQADTRTLSRRSHVALVR